MECDRKENENCNTSTGFLINYDLETVLSDKQNAQHEKSSDSGCYSSSGSAENSYSEACSHPNDMAKAMRQKATRSSNNNSDVPKDEEDALVAALVPKLKNIQLSKLSTKPSKAVRLAGYVRTVIPRSTSALIQVATGSRILDIGTSTFIQIVEGSETKYLGIGRVYDILGSVSEPMYSLKLELDEAELALMEVDAKVYYFVDHPDTKYVSVRREINDSYTVIQNLSE